MALLEAKTSFYSEQRRKLEFFLPNNQKSFGLKMLPSSPRSFRIPIRHVRCCRKDIYYQKVPENQFKLEQLDLNN